MRTFVHFMSRLSQETFCRLKEPEKQRFFEYLWGSGCKCCVIGLWSREFHYRVGSYRTAVHSCRSWEVPICQHGEFVSGHSEASCTSFEGPEGECCIRKQLRCRTFAPHQLSKPRHEFSRLGKLAYAHSTWQYTECCIAFARRKEVDQARYLQVAVSAE